MSKNFKEIMSNRGLVLLILVVLAIFSYVIGFAVGMFFFVIVGAVFEILFWLKLIGHKGKSDQG